VKTASRPKPKTSQQQQDSPIAYAERCGEITAGNDVLNSLCREILRQ